MYTRGPQIAKSGSLTATPQPLMRFPRHDQRRSARVWARLIVATAQLIGAAAISAQPADQDVKALKRLTLEDLMDVDVTSVSRRSEPLSEAAAAIVVISGDEIRRTGATTLVEALRVATGLTIARVDGTTWAVSARGFTGTAANKLLVLIDGRSIYSPLFSGVFWDVRDTMLADIDRVEVVRGPGATLWGANAVNGVVNVITRHTSRTQGGRVELGSGRQEPGIAAVRYGDSLGKSAFYRAYAKLNYETAQVTEAGVSAGDPLRRFQVGGRLDWKVAEGTDVMVVSDGYLGRMGRPSRPETDVNGGNVLARIRHEASSTAEWQVQTYFDGTFRSQPGVFEESRGTFDLEVQYRARTFPRHALLAGGGYRVSHDHTSVPPSGGPPTTAALFDPASRSLSMAALFAQDEITLVPKKATLTLGARGEYNTLGGFQLQPTVRARWMPRARHVVWGAVSRAVRTPTRLDADIRVVLPDGSVTLVGGGDEFHAESVVAYEGGYRLQPIAWLSVDLAAYHNEYDHLRSQRPGPPIVLANDLFGHTNGLETQVTVRPNSWMRWQGSWTAFDKRLDVRPGHADVTGGAAEGNDPPHQLGLRGTVNLPHRVELDGFLRHVAELPAPVVPAYTELDLRAGWALTDDVEIAVVGRNLLHGSHPEFGAPGPNRVWIERNISARLRVSF
jgi:iron complex outermembrane receptor protein